MTLATLPTRAPAPEPERDSPPPLTFSIWVAGILRRRRLVLAVAAGTLAGAIALGLLLPPSYNAHTSFVANAASTRLPGGLGGGALQGLTAQLGLGSLSDPAESPAFYARLVESNELRRRLVTSSFADPRASSPADSAMLVEILRARGASPEERIESAVRRLRSRVTVAFDQRTNMVSVMVSSRWPELAAAVANRTVELVVAFNQEQRVSRAQEKRIFLERRLATAEADLRRAEERQRQFYEQNRLWRNAPSLVFEEGRFRRNVEFAGDIYASLRQQFEAARLEEFNDAALITVVDTAVVPHRREWPRWGILLVASVLLGLILGVGTAGSAVIMQDWRSRNPTAARFFSESLPAMHLRRRGRRTGGGTVAG